MQTIYDWVTVGLFAALIVLFLHRSAMDDPPDRVWHYLPPSIGCAVCNQLGNQGYHVAAIAILLAVGVYVALVLKPHVNW